MSQYSCGIEKAAKNDLSEKIRKTDERIRSLENRIIDSVGKFPTHKNSVMSPRFKSLRYIPKVDALVNPGTIMQHLEQLDRNKKPDSETILQPKTNSLYGNLTDCNKTDSVIVFPVSHVHQTTPPFNREITSDKYSPAIHKPQEFSPVPPAISLQQRQPSPRAQVYKTPQSAIRPATAPTPKEPPQLQYFRPTSARKLSFDSKSQNIQRALHESPSYYYHSENNLGDVMTNTANFGSDRGILIHVQKIELTPRFERKNIQLSINLHEMNVCTPRLTSARPVILARNRRLLHESSLLNIKENEIAQNRFKMCEKEQHSSICFSDASYTTISLSFQRDKKKKNKRVAWALEKNTIHFIPDSFSHTTILNLKINQETE